MAETYWRKDGKIIKDSSGRLIKCSSCPCKPTDPCAIYPDNHKITIKEYGTWYDYNTGECTYDSGIDYTLKATRNPSHCSKSGNNVTFYYTSEDGYTSFYITYNATSGKFVSGYADTYDFPPVLGSKPSKPDCYYYVCYVLSSY